MAEKRILPQQALLLTELVGAGLPPGLVEEAARRAVSGEGDLAALLVELGVPSAKLDATREHLARAVAEAGEPAAEAIARSSPLASLFLGIEPRAAQVRTPAKRSPKAPAPLPEAGGQVSGHKLSELLGSGPGGAVFKVQAPGAGVRAMRLVRGWDLQGKKLLERFQTQARVACDLNHPGVAKIHDVGLAEEWLFYTLLYLPRGTLAARLERGPLPLAEALRIARQVAETLAYLENAGLAHQDIRPSRILFKANDQPVLAELSVARRGAESAALFGMASAAASPAYLPPEALRPGAVPGGELDRWALGATLYHMLCGKPPYDASAFGRLRQEEAGASPEPPRSLRPEIPQALEDAVLKVLARDPEERFRSVQALIEALSAAEPAPTPKPRPVPEAAPPPVPTRGPGRWVALAIGAVVLLAAGWGWFRHRGPDPRPSGPPVKSIEGRAAESPVAEAIGRGDLAAVRRLHEAGGAPVLDALTAPLLARLLVLASQDASGEALALSAGRALAQGHPADARRFADEVLAVGTAAMEEGRYLEALQCFRRRLALVPEDAQALLLRGEVQVGLGEDRAALADLDRAAKLLPADPRPLLFRGLARLNLGELPAALTDLDAAAAARPEGETRARILFLRGVARLLAGQPGPAADDLGHAARHEGTVTVELCRALARAAQGDAVGARDELVRLLPRAPGGILGSFRYASFLQIATRLIDLLPEHPLAHAERGMVHLSRRERAPALRDLERALALAPADAPYRTGLAKAIERARGLPEAKR